MTIREKQLNLISNMKDGERIRLLVKGTKFSITLRDGVWKVKKRSSECRFFKSLEEIRGYLGLA